MTNVIIGQRCSGKTTRLIRKSAKKLIPILTSTRTRVDAIWGEAQKMGLDIPFPITLDEYLHSARFRGSDIQRTGLLIDDVDDVIGKLFAGIPIHEVTMTDYGNIEQLSLDCADTRDSVPLSHECKNILGNLGLL